MMEKAQIAHPTTPSATVPAKRVPRVETPPSRQIWQSSPSKSFSYLFAFLRGFNNHELTTEEGDNAFATVRTTRLTRGETPPSQQIWRISLRVSCSYLFTFFIGFGNRNE